MAGLVDIHFHVQQRMLFNRDFFEYVSEAAMGGTIIIINKFSTYSKLLFIVIICIYKRTGFQYISNVF